MTGTEAARPIVAGLAAALASATVGLAAMVAGGLYLDPAVFGVVLLIIAFPVALLHGLFLAAPLYFALLQRWPLRWWNAALAGFMVGATPIGAVALVQWASIDVLFTVGCAGFCGLVGGVVFRAVGGPVAARPRSEEQPE